MLILDVVRHVHTLLATASRDTDHKRAFKILILPHLIEAVLFSKPNQTMQPTLVARALALLVETSDCGLQPF